MANRLTLSLILITGMLFQSCGGSSSPSPSSGTSGPSPADTTKPTVMNTNPINAATGIPTNATLVATFSEPLDPMTPSSTFTLAEGTTPKTGTVSFSGTTATFTPSAKLGNTLSYTATLTTGIKDLAGNALASPHTWSFITSDCNGITLINQVNLGAVASGSGYKSLATDGTSVYLYLQDAMAAYGTLLQINPLTGAVITSTNLPMVTVASTTPNAINFIADITWHGGAIWASGSFVTASGALSQGVFKVNLATGLAENQLRTAAGVTNEVPIYQGLASDGVNLYAAIDRNYPYPTPIEHVIVKFDPASSTQVPLAPALLKTVGQATRLTFGNGSLFVFNNPNFEKVDPVSGAVLSNYCKNDGGANILYLNQAIWSIKDTVLFVYTMN